MKRFVPTAATARFVGIVAAILIVVPIALVSIAGSMAMKTSIPMFANTTAKSQRAELMRGYGLAPDPSIDPAEAGRALRALANRKGPTPLPMRPIAQQPYVLPVADAALFGNSSKELWGGPSPERVLEMAQKGFSPAEMQYLANLAALPAWKEFATVARAPRMDEAAGLYTIPFPPDFPAFDLPILPFAPVKQLAYASTARAAWYLANGHPDDADHSLRETISYGFKLMDDGNSLIDHLIGAVVVGIGRSGLEHLYAITGNAELSTLQARTAEFDARQHIDREAGTRTMSESALRRVIADSAIPRGLRMELTRAAAWSVCGHPRQLLFGPSEELRSAIAASRRRFARSDAEGALFDLEVGMLDHGRMVSTSGLSHNPVTRAFLKVARVPAVLLHNPRITNCAIATMEFAGIG